MDSHNPAGGDLTRMKGPIFAVGPDPLPADQGRVLKALARMSSAGEDGTVVRSVMLFTSADLAQRFIDENFSTSADRVTPIRFPTLADLNNTLVALAIIGETHVTFDPGTDDVQPRGILRVLEGIRDSQRW